jgi:hypothetical protein
MANGGTDEMIPHPYPLSLSQEQLDIVMRYAKEVSGPSRKRFLEALTDELLPCEITNAALHAAIGTTLRRLKVGTS